MSRRVILALVALGIIAAVIATAYGSGDKGLLGRAGIKPR